MPVRLPVLPSAFLTASLLRTRTRRVVVTVLVVVLFLLTFAYHAMIALVGEDPALLLGSWIQMTYNVVVVLCYGVLLLAMSYYIERQRLGPLRVFWSSVVLGLLSLGVGFCVLVLFPESDTFTVGTAANYHLLSFLEAFFGFALLLNLRTLVLYRRTKASVRNWYVMAGLMALTALTAFPLSPDESPGLPTLFFIGLTTIAMVVNSFRLSWIVFLSFRQKALIIGLCVALTALVAFLLFDSEYGIWFDFDAAFFARLHSYSLSVFVMLCLMFGLLYSITTFLSLLFHLPTTSDFQKKAGEVAALHSVTRLTSEMFDRENLFAVITASPVEAGTAQSAWLAISDPSTGSLRPHIVSTYNITPAQVTGLIDVDGLYEEAAQRSSVVLLNRAVADHRVRARSGDGIESLLVIPLHTRDQCLGALFVAKEVSNGFEDDDVDIIRTLADQAALALDNARLIEEQVEKERMARELDIAHEVQKKLLPQTLPSIEGATLAASSVPALEVGGDYYDFVQIDENQIGIIVGDVSGKGTSAAFYMAELKGIFQSLSHLSPSPSVFLVNANRALVHSMERNTFISVVYGILDLESKVLTLARAGHCPVAFTRCDGEARFLRSRGMGLGLDSGALFKKTLHEERIELAPGDAFVFYTDGIVESRGPSGEEYGYDRLLKAVSTHRSLKADALHAALLEDLRAFLGHNRYDDDLTLVVLKWNHEDPANALQAASNQAVEELPPPPPARRPNRHPKLTAGV